MRLKNFSTAIMVGIAFFILGVLVDVGITIVYWISDKLERRD